MIVCYLTNDTIATVTGLVQYYRCLSVIPGRSLSSTFLHTARAWANSQPLPLTISPSLHALNIQTENLLPLLHVNHEECKLVTNNLF